MSSITDQRMLLSVSPTQTTLYDQIRFSGTPSEFAWVLPIHGIVEVGLSADVLFDAMDALTATRIVSPPTNCPSPRDCNDDDGLESARATSDDDSANGGVTVTKQENVGPYATVQLKATDAGALNRWLVDNGYQIPDDVKPIIAQYVNERFDFLAMKLLPNQGIQAMRPVRITSPGASLSMPLRMASVGSGVTVGITIWVVSDGRYEPQNFPFFRIDDQSLVWDFATSSSNYTTLRAQRETAFEGRGWEIESSIALNQQVITSAILSGGFFNGGRGGASDASEDYLPVEADADAGLPGATAKTAEEVRTEDVTTLFAGMTGPNARVTRMRSDIRKAAMTSDLVLQASPAQDELSNVRLVTESVNLTCPVYDGCRVVGTGTLAEAERSVAVGGGGGCVTTPRSRPSEVALGLAVCALGLVVSRVVRARRARA